jgi:triosephosphate isomerase (TIM)
MRQFLIAGNWKMHTTPAEASALAASVARGIANSPKSPNSPNSSNVHVLMCAPYTSIHAASEALHSQDASASARAVSIGAQNCHHETKGAFTGEIAATMLHALGCTHVILGHSERRQYNGETDTLLNAKLKAALQAGLVPVYCVGETLAERQAGTTFDVIRTQMDTALDGIALDPARNGTDFVIAYEPVWAIGTGLAATSDQAQEVHAFIREQLRARYGALAAGIALLYGGSMKPDNAAELLAKPDVNGGLIGGAALQAESFLGIIAAAQALA